MTLSTFRRRVALHGELTLRTALHVGVGRALEPLGTDLTVARDAFDRPLIPGSSFRGALRASVESLVRGIQERGGRLGQGACDPLDDNGRCMTARSLKDWEKEHGRAAPGERAAFIHDRLCPVCRLFGTAFYASRVRVADLTCVEAPPIEVRDGVGIDRSRRAAREKVLYDFEIVPAGSIFRWSITADNPEDWELGMLAAGLELFDSGLACVGGKAARGLGQVELVTTSIVEEDPRTLLDRLAGKHRTPADEKPAPAQEAPAPLPDEERVFQLMRAEARNLPDTFPQESLWERLRNAGLDSDKVRAYPYIKKPDKPVVKQLFEEAMRRGVLEKVAELFRLARPPAPKPAAPAPAQSGIHAVVMARLAEWIDAFRRKAFGED